MLAGAVPANLRRNLRLRLLHDLLSTLADAVGPALAEVGRPRPFARQVEGGLASAGSLINQARWLTL